MTELERKLGDKDRKEKGRRDSGRYCVSYNKVFGFSLSTLGSSLRGLSRGII